MFLSHDMEGRRPVPCLQCGPTGKPILTAPAHITIVNTNQDSTSSRLLPGSSYSCCICNLHALVHKQCHPIHITTAHEILQQRYGLVDAAKTPSKHAQIRLLSSILLILRENRGQSCFRLVRALPSMLQTKSSYQKSALLCTITPQQKEEVTPHESLS
jgi:hypothetical protein